MVHIIQPDQHCHQWEAYIEDRHGAVTICRHFDTEAEARAQAKAWNAEMDRTGITIGSVAASYERQ